MHTYITADEVGDEKDQEAVEQIFLQSKLFR
jgi:hypothetical protein